MRVPPTLLVDAAAVVPRRSMLPASKERPVLEKEILLVHVFSISTAPFIALRHCWPLSGTG